MSKRVNQLKHAHINSYTHELIYSKKCKTKPIGTAEDRIQESEDRGKN